VRRLALILLAALSGCTYVPPPGQVDAPGRISGGILDRWSVSLETSRIVPLVLTDAKPRRDQLGAVVTYHHPF
jgi:hypothetical protein